jgi:hypothetical protein
MKTANNFPASWRVFAASSLLVGFSSLAAENFSIDWFGIDGGGGSSAGGAYILRGSIGQPEAGAISGGSYAIVSGFWGNIQLIQTAGSPRLSVEPAAGGVRIFWPVSATGFVLDESTAMVSPPLAISWSPAPFPYETNATHISIKAPIAPGEKFYRLRRP